MRILFHRKNRRLLNNKCAQDYIHVEQKASQFLTLIYEARKFSNSKAALEMVADIERVAHIYSYSKQYDFLPTIDNYAHLTNQMAKLNYGIGILSYFLETNHVNLPSAKSDSPNSIPKEKKEL